MQRDTLKNQRLWLHKQDRLVELNELKIRRAGLDATLWYGCDGASLPIQHECFNVGADVPESAGNTLRIRPLPHSVQECIHPKATEGKDSCSTTVTSPTAASEAGDRTLDTAKKSGAGIDRAVY